ncbi:hypothetical protein U5640_27660 [Streptomyces sp. SS7]|uniref:hypothetical protein n=1 Tax=Streptomyces sp. SS7 TaxID=3108485 RepID=UPI0030EE70BB
MPDFRLQMAYEAAEKRLAAQTSELARIRNRAFVVLVVIVLATALMLPVGLLRFSGNGAAAKSAIPEWSAWLALGILVIVFILVMLILSPPRQPWRGGPPPEVIIERQQLNVTENNLVRDLAVEMSGNRWTANNKCLELRSRLLQVSILLLLIEIVILLTLFARGQ